MATSSILIVEDEREFMLLLCMALERIAGGAEVGEAVRADHALAQAAATQPDLILLDVHLPDLDGWTLLPRMRHASPASTIVMMSSDPDTNALAASEAIWIDKARLLAALPGVLSGAGISA